MLQHLWVQKGPMNHVVCGYQINTFLYVPLCQVKWTQTFAEILWKFASCNLPPFAMTRNHLIHVSWGKAFPKIAAPLIELMVLRQASMEANFKHPLGPPGQMAWTAGLHHQGLPPPGEGPI